MRHFNWISAVFTLIGNQLPQASALKDIGEENMCVWVRGRRLSGEWHMTCHDILVTAEENWDEAPARRRHRGPHGEAGVLAVAGDLIKK